MKSDRRLKQNKRLRNSCDYLLKEVAYIQNSIDFLSKNGGSMEAIERLREQQRNLKCICEELKCPEDLSPEAITYNKELLREINLELAQKKKLSTD